jgi:aminoglycoside 3-N-acetyltransferase
MRSLSATILSRSRRNPNPRSITECLDRLRIPRDGILLVHSSFRGLSREGLTPANVVDDLVAFMSPGTLVMPTMSWRFVTPKTPEFRELDTPSNTGILTELFRTTHATARSLHPTHSCAARGDAAAALLAEHHLDPTPCSARSPFGKVVQQDGWILMLGISIDCCTVIHYGEELIAPNLYLRRESEAQEYGSIDRAGRRHRVVVRRHLFLPRDFWQFQDALASRGHLRISRVGSVVCRAFRARDLHAEVSSVLGRRPDAIIARAGQRFRRM